MIGFLANKYKNPPKFYEQGHKIVKRLFEYFV